MQSAAQTISGEFRGKMPSAELWSSSLMDQRTSEQEIVNIESLSVYLGLPWPDEMRCWLRCAGHSGWTHEALPWCRLGWLEAGFRVQLSVAVCAKLFYQTYTTGCSRGFPRALFCALRVPSRTVQSQLIVRNPYCETFHCSFVSLLQFCLQKRWREGEEMLLCWSGGKRRVSFVRVSQQQVVCAEEGNTVQVIQMQPAASDGSDLLRIYTESFQCFWRWTHGEHWTGHTFAWWWFIMRMLTGTNASRV